MSVISVGRSIGLVSDARGEVSGTIDQNVVLAAISGLATAHPGHDDLLADAARSVRCARSAGLVQPDRTGHFYRSPTGATVQLRYRSEMADVFTDLAIDIGLGEAKRLADATA